MNNQQNNTSVFKKYIVPIFAVVLVLGAVALLAGSSKIGNVTSNFFGSSSETVGHRPIYSLNNFTNMDGYQYYHSPYSDGSVNFVDEDASRGKVFQYIKNNAVSSSGERIAFLEYKNEVDAHSLVASFDIYLDSTKKSNSVMSYQIYFNQTLSDSPFIGSIKTSPTGFSFGEMSASSGTTPTSVTSVLSYDTWHTIKIEINLSSEEAFEVTYYADNEVIGTSDCYNMEGTGKLKTAVQGIYFISNSSIVSLMKLDNISLYVDTIVY